ncbi:MAG: hypothetical protein JW751_06950 [Polyangiaceae bacterium]|nr:hypothetical protein [Polyangiaceae bacterium]
MSPAGVNVLRAADAPALAAAAANVGAKLAPTKGTVAPRSFVVDWVERRNIQLERCGRCYAAELPRGPSNPELRHDWPLGDTTGRGARSPAEITAVCLACAR